MKTDDHTVVFEASKAEEAKLAARVANSRALLAIGIAVIALAISLGAIFWR